MNEEFSKDESQINIHLLAEERLINVEALPIRELDKYPSALKALMQLTGVDKPHDIGRLGTCNAACVTRENQNLPDLRLFETLFGRDALRVALDTFEYFPELARSTVLELARLQGVKTNPASEEEPGKIILVHRNPTVDIIAQQLSQENGWNWPYYASVDATSMFISTIAKIVARDGEAFLEETYIDRNGLSASIGIALERSITWLTESMTRSAAGLVEYRKNIPRGHLNHVWRDSWDAYFHSNGEIANHNQPIATFEAQVLAFDALLDAAEIYETIGKFDPMRLRQLAARLKQDILDIFWIEDERGGYFAPGFDRDDSGVQRLFKVRFSDMGHALPSRLLEDGTSESQAKVKSLIKTLFSKEMLAPAGIRTISNREIRFRDVAYHNGTVWPWDTYYNAQGLEQHGYYGLSYELRKRLYNTIKSTKKFPEFVRGDEGPGIHQSSHIIDVWDEKNQRINRLAQPPQEIQAWTVAAILASKYKFQPLRPGKGTPLEAIDPDKRTFELQILASLT